MAGPEVGCCVITRHYLGGFLSGVGVCGVAVKYLDANRGVGVLDEPGWLLGGGFLFLAGSVLAYTARRRIEHRRPQYVPEDHRL